MQVQTCVYVSALSSLGDVLSASLLAHGLFPLDLHGLCHRLARFSGLMAAPLSLKGDATTDYSPCFRPTARKIIIGAIFFLPPHPQDKACKDRKGRFNCSRSVCTSAADRK